MHNKNGVNDIPRETDVPNHNLLPQKIVKKVISLALFI